MSRRQAAKPQMSKAEAARQQAEREREDTAMFRKVCTGFMFWRVCGAKACRRTKGCAAGDTQACFNRLWPYVSEYDKSWFRASIKARNAGHSVEEANRIGNEEAKRCKALAARLEARGTGERDAKSSSPLPLAEEGGEREARAGRGPAIRAL